jgi:hypothetical protein
LSWVAIYPTAPETSTKGRRSVIEAPPLLSETRDENIETLFTIERVADTGPCVVPLLADCCLMAISSRVSVHPQNVGSAKTGGNSEKIFD